MVNVIVAARNIKNVNRIITIFGCGGDRDRTKRPIMAKVVEDLSDIIILTSDNPRTENPEQIFTDVKKGFIKSDDYFFEPDREKAIKLAINMAEKNDIILITGKGHETYHIIGTKNGILMIKKLQEEKLLEERWWKMLINDVNKVKVGNIVFGGKKRFVLIAGPCVMESQELMDEVAGGIKKICDKLGIEYIFKASFDKANRSSIYSYRGPGLEEGMKMLAKTKEKFNVPVITDVHEAWQCKEVSKVADILQIPAFLCRQTDLLIAAAETGKAVNIKKDNF